MSNNSMNTSTERFIQRKKRDHDGIAGLLSFPLVSASIAGMVVKSSIDLYGGDPYLLDPNNSSAYGIAVGLVTFTYSQAMSKYSSSGLAKLVHEARDLSTANILKHQGKKHAWGRTTKRQNKPLQRRRFAKKLFASALWHTTRASLQRFGSYFNMFQIDTPTSQREVDVAHLFALLGADPSDQAKLVRESDAFSDPDIQSVLKNSDGLLALLAENTPSIRKFTGHLLNNLGDDAKLILGEDPRFTRDTLEAFHQLTVNCYSKAIKDLNLHNTQQYSVHLINEIFGREQWSPTELNQALGEVDNLIALENEPSLKEVHVDVCGHMREVRRAVMEAIDARETGPIQCPLAGLKRFKGFVAGVDKVGRPESLESIWKVLYPEHNFVLSLQSSVIQHFGKQMQRNVEDHDDFRYLPKKQRQNEAENTVNKVLERTAADLASPGFFQRFK